MHPSSAELDTLARGTELPELMAHVAACPGCVAKLRERRALLGVLSELQPHEPSELEWKRVDRHVLEAMDRDIAARAKGRSAWFIAIPALAAVGACAVVGLKLLSMSQPPVPQAFVAPPMPAVALAEGGEARTGRSGPEILEGDLLDASRGTLQVQTAPATGIALSRGARARASRLRVGETGFTLEQGELLAEVKPLAPGAQFAVHAGDLTVHVVGTAFTVMREAGQVKVAVLHGRVRVDRAGKPGEIFVPGGSAVAIPDGAALEGVALAPVEASLASRFPLGFPDLQPDEVERQYGQAEIESEPAGADARLDGASRGVTPLTVLAAEGTHQVELRLPGRAPQKHTLKVSRTRAQATISLPLAPEPVVAAPVAPPAPVVQPPARSHKTPIAAPAQPVQVSFAEALHSSAVSHRQEVQACYTQLNGELDRRLHLVFALQPTGAVAPPVRVEEPGVDPAFADCVTRAARTWSFPPPGREFEVSIPFDLTTPR